MPDIALVETIKPPIPDQELPMGDHATVVGQTVYMGFGTGTDQSCIDQN